MLKSKVMTLVTVMVCGVCHGQARMERITDSVFFYDYAVHCPQCKKDIVSDERDVFEAPGEDGSMKKWSKRTLAAVYATMCSGMGQRTLTRITTAIGLKYLAKSQYHKYKDMIIAFVNNIAYDHLLTVCGPIVYDYYVRYRNAIPDKDGIIDIYVMIDGSWKSRGWVSILGVGTLIEYFTGILLDFEPFSKNCKVCNTYTNKVNKQKMTRVEYEAWKKTHEKSGKCDLNFEGSSGMMEVQAAENMFKRSVARYNMRYKYIISDGDSKTFKNLTDVKPYGPNFEMIKRDCLNHQEKKMGTGLRKERDIPLLPEVLTEQLSITTKSPKVKGKGTPLSKGLKRLNSSDKKKAQVKIYTTMKGKNGLTDSDIDAHQRYYKISLRSHSTAQEMNKAIWGTFLHFTSTDDVPRHIFCNIKWCWFLKYEKDKEEAEKKWDEDCAKSDNPFYSKKFDEKAYHRKNFLGHENVKRRIKFEEGSEPYKRIRYVYTRLSNNQILERCEDKFTQNAVESMHRRYWMMCPKHKYSAFPSFKFSLAQNVLFYHFGYDKGNLLNHFGIEATKGMKSLWSSQEYDRKKVVVSKPRKKKSKKCDSYASGEHDIDV